MRAIAVLLVVMFHLGLRSFRSGFLGVDVFFVISGFLITTILLAETARTGRISLSSFWARRARRLLPALVLMLITVAVIERLIATMTEREALRADLMSTIAYIANWHFIGSAAYFANTGVPSPLEHTWSLAIEEQFYLIWPLVITAILVLWIRSRTALASIAVIGVVVSASLLALRWQPQDVERAYMGTDARIFEPLVGALGAIIVRGTWARGHLERHGAAIAFVGAFGATVAIALILLNGSVYYFGGALLVCVLTVALLSAVWVGPDGVIRRVLRWPPLVWVGLISYGVYLWHWPLTLWLDARDPMAGNLPLRRVGAVVLTIAVAAISFYVVERPVRQAGGRSGGARTPSRFGQPRVVLIAIPVVLSLVACTSIALTRVPPASTGALVVMMTGDSVPKHLIPALEGATNHAGWRFVDATRGGCPVSGEDPVDASGDLWIRSAGCVDQVVPEQDEAVAETDPDIVIWWDRPSVSTFRTADGQIVLSGSPEFWRLRRETLASTVQRLTEHGAIVVLVATEPVAPGIDTTWPWAQFMIEHYFDITTKWNAMMRRYAQEHPQLAAYVSITESVCHAPISSPCDDTVDGFSARPQGQHFEGPGATVAVDALLAGVAPLIRRLGKPLPSAVADA